MSILKHALTSAFGKKGITLPAPQQANQPICSYCSSPAKLVGGDVIYPHRPDLYKKKFWQCAPCEAYVGCHEAGRGYGDGTRPLGRLANAELRQAKMAVHEMFDDIWKEGHMRRPEAYAWLADKMGIAVENCHVGMFTVEQCHQAADICEAYWDALVL